MDVIAAFYKNYYEENKAYFLEFQSEKFGLTEDNYWDTVLESSRTTIQDFKSIEKRLEKDIPESFKHFFMHAYSIYAYFDLRGISIVGSLKTSPLSELRKYFFELGISEELMALDLLPFGVYEDEWYICLDLSQDEEHPPIVLFEMSQWYNGVEAKSHKNWFSNFESFIACMASYIDGASTDAFDTIDPAHHFSTAYNYWK